MSDFIDSNIRKARKKHFCCACLRPISEGDTYLDVVHKDCGEIMNSRWHRHCDEFFQKNRLDGENELEGSLWDWDGFKEFMENH